MKPLNQYIKEKLIINKDYRDNTIVVKTFDELRNIVIDRYNKLGPGTKQNPIDFNDIDVSNLDSFCDRNMGIFSRTDFKYIDISYWNVSSVTDMSCVFWGCLELKSVGYLSYWNVSNVKSTYNMFFGCKELESVGDISEWDVSNVRTMRYMFAYCKELKSVGDISYWNVSKVTDMWGMFLDCKFFNQDISKWDVSNVRHHYFMFDNCPIKEEYKPKFK